VLLLFGFVITELSVMEQRCQAVLEVEAGLPMLDVADRFGVSRQAIHRWVARYRGGGLEALADRSKRPKSPLGRYQPTWRCGCREPRHWFWPASSWLADLVAAGRSVTPCGEPAHGMFRHRVILGGLITD
jgi:hypothetical protein